MPSWILIKNLSRIIIETREIIWIKTSEVFIESVCCARQSFCLVILTLFYHLSLHVRKTSLTVPSDIQFVSGALLRAAVFVQDIITSCPEACLWSPSHSAHSYHPPLKGPRGLSVHFSTKHPSVMSLASREQKVGSSARPFTLCSNFFSPLPLPFLCLLHTRTVTPQLWAVYDLPGMAVLLIHITLSQNSFLQPHRMVRPLSLWKPIFPEPSSNPPIMVISSIAQAQLSAYLVCTQDT